MKSAASQGFTKYGRLIENVLYPLIALALFLGVWAIAASVKNLPIILPEPKAVFESFGELFVSKAAWIAVGGTLLRALESYALSFAFALLLASLGALFRPLHKILSPIVSILRSAPTMAIILLAVLWLDYDEVPVLIGFLICFPLLYSSVYSAFTNVDKELLEMADVYKVSAFDRMRTIYLPSILPSVLDGVKSTVSLNVKVVIAAEVIAQTKNSIGLEMQRDNLVFEVTGLLAWTALAIIISMLLELAVSGLKKLWEAMR